MELHITFDEQTGNVNVNGPIGNKGLCYLMLECARDAVKDHVDKVQQQIISPVELKPLTDGLGFVRRRNRKR